MSNSRPGWPVRTLTEDDRDAAVELDGNAFGSPAPTQEAGEQARLLLQDARMIGAFDGATLAGIAAAYRFRVGVPGGSAPAAGVTWVGVLPTHRRRGVLSALMTHQLHALHEAGDEAVAILWASEPQIYGRFGYGLASRLMTLSVPRSAHALVAAAPIDPDIGLRIVEASDWKLFAAAYDTVAGVRPGLPARDELWWQRAVRDDPGKRGGRSPLRAVLAEDSDGVRGYALYSTTQAFDDSFGSGTVNVREVLATDAPALVALYRYLFDLDLMGRTELWNVPVDDPVLHWLQNPRRAKPALSDGLYSRLVDVPRALTGRSYAAPLDVVLEVNDAVCPWNTRRWRLTGGPGGAGGCDPTTDPADVTLGVTDLGAAYLGGTTLAELAAAGRVVEQSAGAVAATSAAFSHSPAPWCPAVF